jgi:ribonuclease HI
MINLTINTDGGSRGNPGPAGIGVKIEIRNSNDEIRIEEISEYIGETTNNIAEYKAVLKALEWVKINIKGELKIEFFLDSQLVVEQLNERYKLKNDGLKPIFTEIKRLVFELGDNISFDYIPREKNQEADALVNKALDAHLKED